MEKESIEDNINSNVIDLLIAYGMLKSTVEIFSEAVDYDNDLENKYINMIKLIEKLVNDVEPCIKDLCGNLDKLLIAEENQKV